MKTIFPALLLCLAFGSASRPVAAGENVLSGMSNASGAMSQGASMVVGGSIDLVAASGTVVIASVETAGEASVVVLKGVADGATATVRLSGEVVRGGSLAAGASVSLVAASTGYLLVSAGKVLAFIPNEIGKSLLSHSRVGG